ALSPSKRLCFSPQREDLSSLPVRPARMRRAQKYRQNIRSSSTLTPGSMPETSPLSPFSAPTRDWFQRTFAAPTAAQAEGWAAIGRSEHTLILAPTGSGKTLAAFLWCLDRLATQPLPDSPKNRCRVLYVSPLKALAHDVERNLKAPLVGIGLAAQRISPKPPKIEVAIRNGGTSEADKHDYNMFPAHLLITHPDAHEVLE